MSPIKSALNGYRGVEKHIFYAVAAQFFVQGVNTAFFLLLNYYMVAEGYADYEVAEVLSYRFLAVFWLAFPLGFFIKGRRLRPLFLAAVIAVPVCSHVLIWAIGAHWNGLVYAAAGAWGIAYTLMQATILPFILLNARPEKHSEAISLSFLSFSVTTAVVGSFYWIVNQVAPGIFDEKLVLQIVATLALAGVWFVLRIRVREKITEKVPLRRLWRDYDWRLIFTAVAPTIIISLGAGFTIPVINLFFLNVHGLASEHFSVLGSLTFILVAGVMIFMPLIRRSFGYRVAITLFQSLSIFALLNLALTEYYKDWPYALGVAMFFFVARQPLMNAAGPMTSELILYFVGRGNQEIIGALNASIWSGSWFLSTRIFSWLRQMEFRYVTIFLITVAFYIVGVAWYAILIRKYERRTGKNGKEGSRAKAAKRREPAEVRE